MKVLLLRLAYRFVHMIEKQCEQQPNKLTIHILAAVPPSLAVRLNACARPARRQAAQFAANVLPIIWEISSFARGVESSGRTS
jgi:hypothetical protein